MRRGITSIAAGITAFVLVISGSVVYAYRAQAEAASRSLPWAAVAQPISERAADNTQGVFTQLAPTEAAALAGNLLQRTDVYSVELGDWQGQAAYKVTFSSGDVAFISFDGQLLGTVAANSYVVYTGGGGGGGGHVASQNDENEHDDDHESEHEDSPDATD